MEITYGTNALVCLGLREKEAKVYGALARLGKATAEQLAKATGVHRRSVYDALTYLSGKGLVSTGYIGEKKVFSTTGLPVFSAWVEENKRGAEEFLKKQEDLQPTTLPVPLVKTFTGKEGIKAVLSDVLRQGEPFFNYGGAGYVSKFLQYYHPHWALKMLKAKIPLKCIFTEEFNVRKLVKSSKLYEARFIPKKFSSYSVWWLYSDKMVLVFWREQPLAIVVEDQELAKTYRNFFTMMWRQAKK